MAVVVVGGDCSGVFSQEAMLLFWRNHREKVMR